MVFDLDDVLCLVSAEREDRYRFERAVRLYQFQTWIYFPHVNLRALKIAGSLAGAAYLERIQRRVVRNLRHDQATPVQVLTKCLQRPSFVALLENVLIPCGDWPRLAQVVGPSEFDRRVWGRLEDVSTVVEHIDYLVRYRMGGGTDPRMMNADHAHYFRWCQKRPQPVSHRKLRGRWSRQRAGAVFLYVDQTFECEFFPRDPSDTSFASDLLNEANDIERTRRFLGLCKGVTDVLAAVDPSNFATSFPACIQAIKPDVEPLTAEELRRFDNYSSDLAEMRRS